MSVIAFPATRKTAHTVARRLRTGGFYSLPPRIWNCVADLAEHLTEAEPTSSQLIFLSGVHQTFLDLSRARR
jgi:hypothetical protein